MLILKILGGAVLLSVLWVLYALIRVILDPEPGPGPRKH